MEHAAYVEMMQMLDDYESGVNVPVWCLALMLFRSPEHRIFTNRTGKRSRFGGHGAGAARATPDHARAKRDLKSVFYSSVRQADTRGRWRAAFCPQAREILAGQMIQYPLDHRRIFSAGENARATCPQGEKP